MKKLHEPLRDTYRNASEKLTKNSGSIKNNQALENLNDKLLDIMNDRVIIASYLSSPLSKITTPENTSQFKLVK